MPQACNRRLLNTVQSSQVAGVSRSTIYLWVAQGKVEYVRTAGGSLRIYADSLWVTEPKANRHADLRRSLHAGA